MSSGGVTDDGFSCLGDGCGGTHCKSTQSMIIPRHHASANNLSTDTNYQRNDVVVYNDLDVYDLVVYIKIISLVKT